LEELKQHEQKYLERKKLSESRHSAKQQDWSYQPPERSERIAQILEEERIQRIKQLDDKKKQLDDKLTRHEEYVTYLRENFVPKVDPLKKEEL
jgi:hypothetical protein